MNPTFPMTPDFLAEVSPPHAKCDLVVRGRALLAMERGRDYTTYAHAGRDQPFLFISRYADETVYPVTLVIDAKHSLDCRDMDEAMRAVQQIEWEAR
jgi:hypothetical protein